MPLLERERRGSVPKKEASTSRTERKGKYDQGVIVFTKEEEILLLGGPSREKNAFVDTGHLSSHQGTQNRRSSTKRKSASLAKEGRGKTPKKERGFPYRASRPLTEEKGVVQN